MFLHVVLYSCYFKKSFLSSSRLVWFWLQVNVDDLFSPLRFRSVRQSGLTLLREDDEPESARQQQPPRITRLQPMEITAFRVEIDWKMNCQNFYILSFLLKLFHLLCRWHEQPIRRNHFKTCRRENTQKIISEKLKMEHECKLKLTRRLKVIRRYK